MADVIWPYEFRDQVGQVASGEQVMANLNALRAVVQDLDLDNLSVLVRQLMFQTGDIRPWMFRTAPEGWLLIAGQPVDARYPELRQLLLDDGAPFGMSGGDPLLPPTPGRALIGAGQGDGLTLRSLGDLVGVERHALSVQELAAHAHGVNDPGHGHTTAVAGDHGHNLNVHAAGSHSHSMGRPWFNSSPGVWIGLGGTNDGRIGLFRSEEGWRTTADGSHTHTGNTQVTGAHSHTVNSARANVSVQSAGGGQAHENMQPSVAVHWLVKT